MTTPYYQAGRVSIYLGDAREIDIPTFHVAVSDPPYGCSATTGWGGKYDGFEIAGDRTCELRDWLIALAERRRAPVALFGSPRIERPSLARAVLIWAKGEHTGMGDLAFPWKPDFEEIYIFGEGWSGPRSTSVLRHNARTDSGRFHPTEKPVALMASIIHRAPPGVVLDPFMGSGSTLVAAKEMNREAVGVELNERYCEIAAKRLDSCCVLPFSETAALVQTEITPTP